MTEYIALIASLITLVAAIVGYFSLRGKVAQVHVLVNQRLTDVMARVTQLTDVLEEHGIDIPHDPNDSMKR
jgi:uncharacterized protein YabE (DUF348 family)